MKSNEQLTLVFTGTEITASILKGLLETADIGSFLKNENESARTSGFGSTGKVEVFIMQKDAEKAQPILKEFSERNP